MTDDEIRAGYQQSALQMTGDITPHDKRHLNSLSNDKLEKQVEARHLLQEYVTELWEDAKLRGINPALSPDWNCIAALRDLAMNLEFSAAEVRDARQEA